MRDNTIELVVAMGALLLLPAGQLNAAAVTADIVVLMDESGSMSGEQNWIKGTILDLDTDLIAAGLTGNRYGSVGFAVGGGPGLTRTFTVGGGLLGTAAEFQSISYSLGGGTEDGWAAISVANTYPFRPEAARNYILVSDEDRDNAVAGLNYAGILASMTGTNTLLNAIVNATFSCGGVRALGIDADGNGYIADGTGGYTTCVGGTAVSGFGTTIANYVNLALDTGGAAWDLNILRSGGLNAQSFSAAFVDIKVGEIQQQPPSIPEPSAVLLMVSAFVGILSYRRFHGA